VIHYRTHLDRLMTELGLMNHELASKAGTSRQAIYKLRNGNTRMLPGWAKRLAPHLGVTWQELVEGPPESVDQSRADLLAAYDGMDDEQRRALLTVAKAMMPGEKPGAASPEPPREPQPTRRRPAACVVPGPRKQARR
jgi:plasmid maintenance system antidote protein VapI